MRLGYLHRKQGKRLFIKDMAHYLIPPNGQPASIAPSLQPHKRGVGTNGVDGVHGVNGVNGTNGSTNGANGNTAGVENPTVVPVELLKKFHWTFLIRDPHYSIPSYYRCTIGPLDEKTGFYNFDEAEAGYDELRRLFDYLRTIHLVGPRVANGETLTDGTNGTNGTNEVASEEAVEICLVDADEMLDNPSGVIERFCKSIGEPYTPEMLKWDTEEHQATAKAAFEKWPGFHEDALDSTCLKARTHVSGSPSLWKRLAKYCIPRRPPY